MTSHSITTHIVTVSLLLSCLQASQYQVAQGGRDQQSAVEGFTLTRQSVTQLNHHVVSALIAAGVPAVGLSPCGVWTTASRQPQQTGAGIAAVQAVLQQGMVPVLHGDCVMDTQLGVTILSGDTIIRVLAKALQPQYCVFLTDVAGLYTAPPDGKPDAVLVQTVEVYPDGSWQVPAVPAAATATVGNDKRDTVGSGSDGKVSVQLSAAVHDTTGGIATKIQEAAGVVLAGCPVVIVQAGTAAGAAAVMKGPSAFSSSSTGGSSQLAGTVIQPADCAEIT